MTAKKWEFDDEDWMGDGKKESEDGGSSHQAEKDAYTVEDWSFDNPNTTRPMTSEERANFDRSQSGLHEDTQNDLDYFFPLDTPTSRPREHTSKVSDVADSRLETGGTTANLLQLLQGIRTRCRKLLTLGGTTFSAFVQASQPYKAKTDVFMDNAPANKERGPSPQPAVRSVSVYMDNDEKFLPKIAALTGAGLGHVIGATVVGTAQLGSTVHKYLFARGKSTVGGKVVKEPFGKWMKRAGRNLVLTVAGGAATVGGCEYYMGSSATSDKPDAQPKSGSDVRGGSTIEDWLDSAGKKAGELGDDVKNWAEKQMK